MGERPKIFYKVIPDILVFNSKIPQIDDPLNPSNNVGKSTFQFEDIQKIFKVGYDAAFLGCFCNSHALRKHESKSFLSVQSQPFFE